MCMHTHQNTTPSPEAENKTPEARTRETPRTYMYAVLVQPCQCTNSKKVKVLSAREISSSRRYRNTHICTGVLSHVSGHIFQGLTISTGRNRGDSTGRSAPPPIAHRGPPTRGTPETTRGRTEASRRLKLSRQTLAPLSRC